MAQTLPFGSSAPFAEPLWYSRNASPFYTASHRQLRAAVRKYVDEEIRPFAEEWEKQGFVPEKVRRFYFNDQSACWTTANLPAPRRANDMRSSGFPSHIRRMS